MMLSPPEPWFLLRLADLINPSFSDATYDCEANRLATANFLEGDLLTDCVRAFASEAYNSHMRQTDKAIFVDKTPRYYYILPFIDKIFPKALKIWLKRNPLDVAVSYKKTWSINVDVLSGRKVTHHTLDMTTGLFNLAAYFSEPSPCKFEIQYETLVTSPSRTLQGLCRFLGVPYEEDMLDYPRNEDLLWQHRRSLLGDKNALDFLSLQEKSVGKWLVELSLAETQQLVDVIGLDVLRRMGYEDVAIRLLEKGIKLPNEDECALARRRIAPHLVNTASEINDQLRLILPMFQRIDESATLRQEINTFQTENVRLKSSLEKTINENVRLLLENEHLRLENQTSLQEHTRLTNERNCLLQDIADSRRENSALEKEFQKVRSGLAEHKKLLEILRFTLEQERTERNDHLMARLFGLGL